MPSRKAGKAWKPIANFWKDWASFDEELSRFLTRY